MVRLRRLFFAAATACALATAGFAVGAAPAAAEGLTDPQRNEVRDLVREYILGNPEIIAEAITVLRTRQMEQEQAAARAALAANADALVNADGDPVLGNPDGDVTLVEFFDYRCGYCKQVFGPVMDLVTSDGNIRLVMKEFPVLGPQSVLAARWSMAANLQDRYKPFHTSLMTHRGDINEAVLRRYAKDAGMDVDQAAKDAHSPAVEDVLRNTMKLAAQLGINGTPAFVIGDQLMPGAVDQDTLKQAVAKARQQG